MVAVKHQTQPPDGTVHQRQGGLVAPSFAAGVQGWLYTGWHGRLP